MSEHAVSMDTDLSTSWKARLEPALCEHCDWRFLLPTGSPAQRCPHCFQADLTLLDASAELRPFPHPPELLLPFSVDQQTVSEKITEFGRRIPLAPTDLSPTALVSRLRRVFLPLWLVDAQVAGQFRAELGYDYQVVSHQERYGGSGWQTQEVQETRVRWEPRLGRVRRAYHNIPAPALEYETHILTRVGQYGLEPSVAYDPHGLGQSFIHLPDRTPEDAWPDAEIGFREAVMRECVQAAEAQHMRDFQWSAGFTGKNWTQLLRPLYTTFYLDDEQQPQPVWVHGRSGQIYGRRRSSMKRARRTALFIGIGGTVFLLLALLLGVAGLAVPALFVAAVVMAAIGFLLLAGALVPLLLAWNFNRQQRRQGEQTPQADG